MPFDQDLAGRMRAILAGTGELREVRMFGGLCFMLNGNMIAGASGRGLLLRVGKELHEEALARPGAKPMQMSARPPMQGYVFVDPPPPDEAGLREWLGLAVAFVRALPPKPAKPTPRRRP